ncbi:hypothetical protein SDJN03_14745, partial [Cucurbita argyrosperma subsp. sororia]
MGGSLAIEEMHPTVFCLMGPHSNLELAARRIAGKLDEEEEEEEEQGEDSNQLYRFIASDGSFLDMAENKDVVPPPHDLNAKWDACLDLTLRRFVYSSLAGAFGGLLFFRSPVTRWASIAFGAGLGIGSAYTDYFTGGPRLITTDGEASCVETLYVISMHAADFCGHL